MDAIVTKQLSEARAQLQAALDAGDNAAADSLMARTKALQQRGDASTHVTTTPNPAARAAAKLPPASTRALPLWQSLTARVVATLENKALSDVLGARFGDLSRKDADALNAVTKVAQNPADTTTTGWAAELVRTTYGAYLEELRAVSVFASLPAQDEDLSGGSVLIPTRDTTATPNLAAAWRKEGAPIRVGAAKLRSVKLEGVSPAVISTFTQELAKRSTPNIQRVIRECILTDSALAFDTKLLSADAAVAGVSPAGLMAGAPAGNSFASTGATPAEIVADLKRAIGTLMNQGLSGAGFAWVMSEFNAMALSLLLTATGALQFPELANGQLLGAGVIASRNVGNDVVYLIDASSVARSLPSPTFDLSLESALHEEDMTPLPIVDNAATPVTAHPVRSLFQTNSCAIRAIYADLSWALLRPAPIVKISSVAW